MSSTDSAAENRRAFIRMKLNSQVVLQAFDESDSYTGTCRDMSGAGLLIATDAPFKVGDKTKVRINSKGSEIVYHTTVNRITNDEGEQRLALSIDEILD